MSTRPFVITAGDRQPAYIVQLLNEDDTPIPLTNATGVTFTAHQRAGGALRISGAMVVIDAPNGTVEYPWQVGDTDVPGNYDVSHTITWAGGEKQTVPGNGYDRLIVQEAL